MLSGRGHGLLPLLDPEIVTIVGHARVLDQVLEVRVAATTPCLFGLVSEESAQQLHFKRTICLQFHVPVVGLMH